MNKNWLVLLLMCSASGTLAGESGGLPFQSADLLKPGSSVCGLMLGKESRSAEQARAQAVLAGGACADATKNPDGRLAQGVAQGHIGAILHVMSGRTDKIEIKISDADLLQALEDAAQAEDPYILHALSTYAYSAHARALQLRTSTSLLLGPEAGTAWLFAACDAGLDCSKDGLMVSMNCALAGYCQEPSLDAPLDFDAARVRELLEEIRARRAARSSFFRT